VYARWDGCQEWANPMRPPAGTLGPKRGDCDVPHRLDMEMGMCLYVYFHFQ
jgi:hypothetical protein